MVSMVLPLLHGAEDAGRRKADSTVARDRAARRGDSEELREGRRDCRRKQRQAVLHWAYDSRTF